MQSQFALIFGLERRPEQTWALPSGGLCMSLVTLAIWLSFSGFCGEVGLRRHMKFWHFSPRQFALSFSAFQLLMNDFEGRIRTTKMT
jgi:hypothetical protein